MISFATYVVCFIPPTNFSVQKSYHAGLLLVGCYRHVRYVDQVYTIVILLIQGATGFHGEPYGFKFKGDQFLCGRTDFFLLARMKAISYLSVSN